METSYPPFSSMKYKKSGRLKFTTKISSLKSDHQTHSSLKIKNAKIVNILEKIKKNKEQLDYL